MNQFYRIKLGQNSCSKMVSKPILVIVVGPIRILAIGSLSNYQQIFSPANFAFEISSPANLAWRERGVS